MTKKVSDSNNFKINEEFIDSSIESTIENNLDLEKILIQAKIESRNKISYIIISMISGLSSVSELTVQFYLKDIFNVQPAELLRLQSILFIPWFIKTIFGLITDMIPICGYRRKFYIIFCGLLDFACLFAISFIKDSLFLFVTLLFLHNSCLSFLTVLSQAILVELSKIDLNEHTNIQEFNKKDGNSSKAKNYVSYYVIFYNLGTFISSIFKVLFANYFEYSTIFRISSFIPLIFIIGGLLCFEVKADILKKFNRQSITRTLKSNEISENNSDLTSLGINFVNKPQKRCQNKIIRFLFQKQILIPIFFIILLIGTPKNSYPMFYFYTNSLHLDPVDIGILSIFGNFSMMTGTLIYKVFLKKKSFRFIVTLILISDFFSSFLGYCLVKRFNLLIGIPDFPIIILYNSIFVMLEDLIVMPIFSLAAILSPEDLEGTSFSIFISAINLGLTLTNLFDSVLTNFLDITNKDLSNIPQLILISNVIKLMPLPIMFYLKKSYFDPKDGENKSSEIEMYKKKEQET